MDANTMLDTSLAIWQQGAEQASLPMIDPEGWVGREARIEAPQTYHAGWHTDLHRLSPGSSPVAGPFCLLPDPALPAWAPQPYSPTASEQAAKDWIAKRGIIKLPKNRRQANFKRTVKTHDPYAKFKALAGAANVA